MRRDLSLVAWQIRYEQRAFWRNKERSLFTLGFPIIFLVIFTYVFKGQHIASRGGISQKDFYVPAILAYGVITTTFVNIANGTAILRDDGVLKRMQGTPLPRWVYVAGQIGSTVLIVEAMAAIMLTLGAVAFGVQVRGSTLPGVIVGLLLGTAAFTTLGIGVVRFIPNAESAPAVVNLAILPLTFISGIWFVTDSIPHWLQDVANVFPIHALADLLQRAFDPRTVGTGLQAHDIRTLLIWTAVGIWIMLRFLRRPAGEAI